MSHENSQNVLPPHIIIAKNNKNCPPEMSTRRARLPNQNLRSQTKKENPKSAPTYCPTEISPKYIPSTNNS